MRTRTKIAAAVTSSLLLFTAGLAVKDGRPDPGPDVREGKALSAYEYRLTSWLDRNPAAPQRSRSGIGLASSPAGGCTDSG